MTYRCDLQTLEEQQAVLQFLWTHLTCQADVVRSSPYVKAFLTEGGGCLATAANRMRQTLQRFRDANRGEDEACGVRGEWGLSSSAAAAAAICRRAAEAVRSVTRFFPSASSAAWASAAAAHRPAEVQRDMAYWEDVLSRLMAQRTPLEEMGRADGAPWRTERLSDSSALSLEVRWRLRLEAAFMQAMMDRARGGVGSLRVCRARRCVRTGLCRADGCIGGGGGAQSRHPESGL
eukprot:gene9010-biopygen6495